MAITFDNVSHTRDTSLATTTTVAHTVAGTNRYLFVVAGDSSGVVPDPTGVTYHGVAMTPLFNSFANPSFRCTGWGLVAPDVGTFNIVITWPGGTGPDEVALGGTSWEGVDPTTPTGTANTANNNVSPATVAIASAVGEVVVDGVYVFQTAIVAGGSQTSRWEEENIGGGTSGGSSSQPGAASVTMQWTFAPDQTWVMGGISLKPFTIAVTPADIHNVEFIDKVMKDKNVRPGLDAGNQQFVAAAQPLPLYQNASMPTAAGVKRTRMIPC